MLNIWGKNIRNKNLPKKSFFEEFQFVLKWSPIKFDATEDFVVIFFIYFLRRSYIKIYYL